MFKMFWVSVLGTRIDLAKIISYGVVHSNHGKFTIMFTKDGGGSINVGSDTRENLKKIVAQIDEMVGDGMRKISCEK